MLDDAGPSQPLDISAASIVDRFRVVVASDPARIALRSVDASWTYGDLDELSDRLAARIHAERGSAAPFVGLLTDRGPLRAIASLAVLKAGAAFVPIDPRRPVETVCDLLDELECAVVITGPDAVERAAQLSRLILELAADGSIEPGTGSEIALPEVGPGDLAYVIYTSGSMGAPKGVMVEHAGVVLLAESVGRHYAELGLRAHGQFFSMAFDGAVWETYTPLLNGLELVYPSVSPNRCTPDEYLDSLNEMEAGTVLIVPSYLAGASPRARPGLPVLVVGAERCPLETARAWASECMLFNAYGPTEITVAATMGRLAPGLTEVSIGRPLAHLALSILRDGQPVATGEVGEIYVSGTAVARGYHNRPELTEQAFVVTPGGRTYRTGDLATLSAEGDILLIGRADDQVKVRGHRIELEEIEGCLRSHPAVLDAVALVVSEGNRAHVAAAVRASVEVVPSELAEYASGRLADYMVPQPLLTFDDDFPRLISGKVDRQRLAALLGDAGPETGTELPALGQLGDVIADCWRAALDVEVIAEGDSFFDLGGDSLTAVEMLDELSAKLGRDIPLRMLFVAADLGSFTAQVTELCAESA